MKVNLGIKEFAPGKFSWMVNICERGTDNFNYIDYLESSYMFSGIASSYEEAKSRQQVELAKLKAAKARWDDWKPRQELETIEI